MSNWREEVIERAKSLVLVGACLGLTAFGFAPAVTRATRISEQNYVFAYGDWAKTHLNNAGDKKITLVVPSIDIYDPSGAVIYHGETAEKNVTILSNLPQQLRGLHVSGLHPSLWEILDMFPELGKEKASILSGRCYSVVAVTSPSGCSKCALQDEAVARLRRQVRQADINVFEVYVQ